MRGPCAHCGRGLDVGLAKGYLGLEGLGGAFSNLPGCRLQVQLQKALALSRRLCFVVRGCRQVVRNLGVEGCQFVIQVGGDDDAAFNRCRAKTCHGTTKGANYGSR